MISTPVRPSASITSRGSEKRSLRKIQASSAVHTGMVNSIANTVARVSAPIEYTHSTWPQKWIALRHRCNESLCVRTEDTPALGSIASTIASITRLRRNTISNEPIWRCSSRTAIAIAVNESTAPPIQRTPCAVGERWFILRAWGRGPFCLAWAHEQEPQARHLSTHLPARLLRAHETDRGTQPGASRAAQALDAHPGAVGPRAAHQDDEALSGLQAGADPVDAGGRVPWHAGGDPGARAPRERRHVRDRAGARRSVPGVRRLASHEQRAGGAGGDGPRDR